MIKMKYLIFIFFGVCAASTSTFALQKKKESHCIDSEKTIFSCIAGKKIISVCEGERNELQYRFGPQDKPEIIFPEKPSNNQFAKKGLSMMSGGGGSFIRFKNGSTNYVVYDVSSSRNSEYAGVIVEKNKKTIADVKCTDISVANIDRTDFNYLEEAEDQNTFDYPIR